MNIAIEARALADKGGIRTYTFELVKHLSTLNEDTIHLLHSTKHATTLFSELQNHLVPLANKRLLPWWLHHSIPKQLDAISPDLVHFTKADVPARKQFPTVVTMYDVIPLILPETQSFTRRYYWPRALARAANRSDHIITISQASKKGIIERLGVEEKKISVIPLSVDTNVFRPGLKTDLVSGSYILFVGRWDARKNIAALIRAFASIQSRIPHTLVIAGNPADKPIDLEAIVREEGVGERVRFLQNVPYDNLPGLYAAADLFVYPSILEGWGFPPQEAMASGTPVIVSDGDPLPEVVGRTGEVVPFSTSSINDRVSDPEFVAALAERIEDVLGNTSRMQEMSRLGREHVENNSWRRVASETRLVYKKVLGL